MYAHNESADPLPTAGGSAPQKRGQEMEHEDQKMEGEARTIKSCLELAYPSLTAMLFQVGEACAFGRFGGSEAAVWCWLLVHRNVRHSRLQATGPARPSLPHYLRLARPAFWNFARLGSCCLELVSCPFRK